MPRVRVVVDIDAPQAKVWHLISDAKETEFWSLNIRDLVHEARHETPPPSGARYGSDIQNDAVYESRR